MNPLSRCWCEENYQVFPYRAWISLPMGSNKPVAYVTQGWRRPEPISWCLAGPSPRANGTAPTIAEAKAAAEAAAWARLSARDKTIISRRLAHPRPAQSTRNLARKLGPLWTISPGQVNGVRSATYAVPGAKATITRYSRHDWCALCGPDLFEAFKTGAAAKIAAYRWMEERARRRMNRIFLRRLIQENQRVRLPRRDITYLKYLGQHM